VSGPAAGLVVAAFGRHYTVELPDGTTRQCYPRGKKGAAAVGDIVNISLQGVSEGAIESIAPRRNLLFRSDQQRSKQFAANVDQLFIVVATEPEFSDDLIGRSLTGAWSAGIPSVILLNKIDRTALLERARHRLATVASLGVPVIELTAHDAEATRARLAPVLAGKTSLLFGQSGMGKSTLLNVLVPGADAATREHSEALGTGRHTTTSTRLYHLPVSSSGTAPGHLIDSPGFQGFGLQHLSREDVERGFPEFAEHASHCRFYNCTHRHEPGCAVLQAVGDTIMPERHALYVRIVNENEAGERY